METIAPTGSRLQPDHADAQGMLGAVSLRNGIGLRRSVRSMGRIATIKQGNIDSFQDSYPDADMKQKPTLADTARTLDQLLRRVQQPNQPATSRLIAWTKGHRK